MEQASLNCSKRHEDADFNLKEWALKAKVSRENTSSRRFSASNLKSFREEAKSFRSSVTISSTVSSPGYTVREEIDPSTYSFTTALKALQAKTVYTWEYLKPDGYVLNSKWSDAEKYICNPLSGEVPLECLSAKTLSGRSFRSLTSRITMSAPLIYPSPHHFQAQTPINEHEDTFKIPDKNKSKTRDVGIQSSSVDLSSGSPSPAKTPSIKERSIKQSGLEAEDDSSPFSSEKLSEETEVVQAKGTKDDDHHEKQFTETNANKKVRKLRKMKTKMMMMCLCNKRGGNQQEEEKEEEKEKEEEEESRSLCLSLKGLVVTRRNKHKGSDACNNI